MRHCCWVIGNTAKPKAHSASVGASLGQVRQRDNLLCGGGNGRVRRWHSTDESFYAGDVRTGKRFIFFGDTPLRPAGTGLPPGEWCHTCFNDAPKRS
jgi:hypothetical protein